MAVPRVVRILERLARQPTAPLHEHAVAAEAARIARDFGAPVGRDAYGNVIVLPPGRRRGAPIWLIAHMDHPGLEVLGRGEGKLLGGVGAPYLRRGLSLRFYHEGRRIAAKLVRYAPKTRRLRFGGDAATRQLRRGDLGVFELPDFRLAGDRVHARQLDDLAGCSVSLAVMERACRSRAMNVHALLTRAEEVGFVGTLAAISERIVPRNAWVVNVEASRAIPGVTIGGGPVIRVGDRTRTFNRHAEGVLAAGAAKLPTSKPVQRALMTGGSCEATAWTVHGWRATGVAIPLGNYHNMGPHGRLRAEVVAVRDLATAVDLLELAARNARRAGGRDAILRERIARSLRRYGPRLRADAR